VVLGRQFKICTQSYEDWTESLGSNAQTQRDLGGEICLEYTAVYSRLFSGLLLCPQPYLMSR